MIKQIDSKNRLVAKRIHFIFQESYAVEAKLLNAIDFPPLKRGLTDFIASTTIFYGYFKEGIMIAVIETKGDQERAHIQSLVVLPDFFRKGIAKKLIGYVFDCYGSNVFTVETGADNIPARALYRKFGFQLVKEWDTDHGIRKVAFEKLRTK